MHRKKKRTGIRGGNLRLDRKRKAKKAAGASHSAGARPSSAHSRFSFDASNKSVGSFVGSVRASPSPSKTSIGRVSSSSLYYSGSSYKPTPEPTIRGPEIRSAVPSTSVSSSKAPQVSERMKKYQTRRAVNEFFSTNFQPSGKNREDYVKSTSEKLFELIAGDKYEHIFALLSHTGPSCLNDQDAFGRTALLMACEGGSLNAAHLILSYVRGSQKPVEITDGKQLVANLELGTREKQTPLHVACQYVHYEIAKLLISKGARVNNRTISGQTPLMVACYTRHMHTDALVQLLLEHGAKPNATRLDGRTALMIAAEQNSIDVVHSLCDPIVTVWKELVDIGEDPEKLKQLADDFAELTDPLICTTKRTGKKEGATALSLAATKGNMMMVSVLVFYCAKFLEIRSIVQGKQETSSWLPRSKDVKFSVTYLVQQGLNKKQASLKLQKAILQGQKWAKMKKDQIPFGGHNRSLPSYDESEKENEKSSPHYIPRYVNPLRSMAGVEKKTPNYTPKQSTSRKKRTSAKKASRRSGKKSALSAAQSPTRIGRKSPSNKSAVSPPSGAAPKGPRSGRSRMMRIFRKKK